MSNKQNATLSFDEELAYQFGQLSKQAAKAVEEDIVKINVEIEKWKNDEKLAGDKLEESRAFIEEMSKLAGEIKSLCESIGIAAGKVIDNFQGNMTATNKTVTQLADDLKKLRLRAGDQQVK